MPPSRAVRAPVVRVTLVVALVVLAALVGVVAVGGSSGADGQSGGDGSSVLTADPATVDQSTVDQSIGDASTGVSSIGDRSTGGSASLAGVVAVADDPADADDENETERHRNPEAYFEDGDDEGLADWFESRLGGQLAEGAIQLSQGQYDAASEHVGESFQDRFSDYVEVAGDTDRESRAEEFEATRDEQENVTESAESYEETAEAYEEAREEGDEERARELARELEEIAASVNASATGLRDHYDALEADTGIDFEDARLSVESVDREIQETQAAIREATFEETVLSVESATETISFLEPMEASGTLVTDDGEPVADETIRLDVGDQSLTVETDGEGAFAFEYRPISIPADADAVSVAYVPDPASVYLGSATSVPAAVEPVEPTIEEPVVDPDTLAFADEFSIATTVTVEGETADGEPVESEPVDGLPLVVTVDGEPLGTLETADGEFEATTALPATVPAGDRELAVTLPFEDRALAGASASTPVTVAETAPSLSFDATVAGDGTDDASVAEGENGTDAEAAGDDGQGAASAVIDEATIAVAGELSAVGDGVGDAAIEIAVEGEPVATVTTDADGTFTDEVVLPRSVQAAIDDRAAGGDGAVGDDGDPTVEVTATYDDAGTNLESVVAAETVTLPVAAEPSSAWRPLGVSAWAWVALGLVGAVLLAIAAGRRVHRRRRDTDEDPGALPAPAPAESVDEPALPPVDDLLADAQSALDADRTDDAVTTAYRATRRTLSDDDASDTLTHREFARAYGPTTNGDAALLESLTDDFERASFVPTPVDGSTAERALSTARTLCGAGDGSATAD